jgi:hypothetical protein
MGRDVSLRPREYQGGFEVTYEDLPHNRIQTMRREVADAVDDYLRKSGWEPTSATPGSYWMWEKTVSGLEYYPGGDRHNRTWLVPKDVAFRLQSDWDSHEYRVNHPEEFEE